MNTLVKKPTVFCVSKFVLFFIFVFMFRFLSVNITTIRTRMEAGESNNINKVHEEFTEYSIKDLRKEPYKYLQKEVESHCKHLNSATLPKPLDLIVLWNIMHQQNIYKPNTDKHEDIQYLFRSYEKYGMFSLIRNVFIVLSERDIRKHGIGPDYLLDVNSQPINSRIHIVRSIDILNAAQWCNGFGDEESEKNPHGIPIQWCIVSKLHRIPELSNQFLLTADDVMLTKPINATHLYSHLFESHVPINLKFGQLGVGRDCFGKNFGAELHGISLVDRCANMVTENFLLKYLNGSLLNKYSFIDALCVQKHALSNLGYLTPQRFPSHIFWTECHTNAGCIKVPSHSFFVNIQGNGISEEYPVNSRLHNTFVSWFHENFPNKSFVERQK